jgi:quercetin dioxygenase-like cupin family protein
MDTMTTVSEVLNNLKLAGYTVDFNLDDNCLICHSNSLKIHPDEFVVDKHYRFEGLSDPDDEAIVYAISSTKHDIKGTLVDGYGISSNRLTNDLVKALTGKRSIEPAESEPAAPERKTNESTPLRPEGDRDLNAPMVTMDLISLQAQIKNEEAYRNGDRNAITIFKSDGMRIVLIALHEGAEMKTHKAPGMISVQVLEGNIIFKTEHETTDRTAGQMLVLHTGIPHSVVAKTASVFLLTLALKAGG